jgi:hypothetical protein
MAAESRINCGKAAKGDHDATGTHYFYARFAFASLLPICCSNETDNDVVAIKADDAIPETIPCCTA